MILRLEVGETAERYLLIENVNDVPVTVTLTTSGDLAENLKLDKETVELQPGEDEKVYFTIKANEEGTTETKVNVAFNSEEGGTGVGLTATVIVVASGESISDEDEDPELDDSEFNFNPSGSPLQNPPASTNKLKFSSLTFFTISTIVLIAIFIGLIVYAKKIKTKKRPRRPSE